MSPVRWVLHILLLLHVLIHLLVVSAIKSRWGRGVRKRNLWVTRKHQPRYPALNDAKAVANVQSANIDIEKLGHFLSNMKSYIFSGGAVASSGL